jgi:hypothetical protein
LIVSSAGRWSGSPHRFPRIQERIKAILALAEGLKKGTIETVLSKSDFDLGLDILLGRRKP